MGALVSYRRGVGRRGVEVRLANVQARVLLDRALTGQPHVPRPVLVEAGRQKRPFDASDMNEPLAFTALPGHAARSRPGPSTPSGGSPRSRGRYHRGSTRRT